MLVAITASTSVVPLIVVGDLVGEFVGDLVGDSVGEMVGEPVSVPIVGALVGALVGAGVGDLVGRDFAHPIAEMAFAAVIKKFPPKYFDIVLI